MEGSATATPARELDGIGQTSETFVAAAGGRKGAGDAGRPGENGSATGTAPRDSLEIPAPHRLRVLAWFIDVLVVGSLTLTVAQVPRLVALLGETAPPFRLGQMALYVVLLLILYHAALVWLTGQTVGKALLNLQVRRRGRAPGLLWSVGRALGYLFVDVFGLGSALALLDRRHRCLHDVVLRSEVVYLGGSPLKAHVLLDRLVAFAERREQSLEEKKKRFSLLKGLLKYLVSLAVAVGWLLDRVARAEAAEAGAIPATSQAAGSSAGGSQAAGSSAMTSPALGSPAVGSSAGTSVVAAASAPGLSLPATVAIAIATTAATVAALRAMPIPLVDREVAGTKVAGAMEEMGSGPGEVPLTGTGTVAPAAGAAASLRAEPSVVDFGNQPVQAAGEAAIVTVSNAGTAGAEIRHIGLAGAHPDDFAVVSDSCSGQVTPDGGPCRIAVLFRPAAAGGRSASLVVEGDAGAPLTVALIGGGSAAATDAPALVAIAAPLDFGRQVEGAASPPASARIVNASAAPVVIRQATVTGDLRGARPDFAIASDGCSGLALPPGASCAIDVTFTPAALGGRSGLLTVEHGSGDPLTVALSGTAVAAPEPPPSPDPSPPPSPVAPLSGPDVLASPPASVVDSSEAGGAANDHQQAFTERRGVVLPADLAVDGGVVAAGTVVDSHMIFFNVADGMPGRSSYRQTWTFDGPVLGVMSDANGALEAASSELLGAPDTTYPVQGFGARGLDLPPGSPLRGSGGGDGEGYTVARNAITVSMLVDQPGDWIRVLTPGRRSPDGPSLSASLLSARFQKSKTASARRSMSHRLG